MSINNDDYRTTINYHTPTRKRRSIATLATIDDDTTTPQSTTATLLVGDFANANNGGRRRSSTTLTAAQSFDDLVTINVAGLRFQTHRRTLDRYPTTLLGSAHRRRRYFNAHTSEYFFDRHRTAFEAILYIYQSCGRVKRPESVPIDLFLREMRFFQMGDHFIEQFWISEGYEKPKEALMPKNMLQRRLWELMEYPDSSLYARIMAFISVAVIIWYIYCSIIIMT